MNVCYDNFPLSSFRLDLGVDIQDENGRHEVGFVDHTNKVPIGDDGCRFESRFEINKVPGNFHLSTHSAATQPETYDMKHIIHSIKFGDDVSVSGADWKKERESNKRK